MSNRKVQKILLARHSRKPDETYTLIESCSEGPYLEMFARGIRPDWVLWGNQANDDYVPDWATYKNNSSFVKEPEENELFKGII